MAAKFQLPPGTSFADLDPIALGARVLIFDPEGLVAEVALAPGMYAGPGTAGWLASANGKTWRYADLTSGTASAVRFTLVDRGDGQPGGLVKWALRANGANLPIEQSGTMRLGAALVLGESAAGDAGLCGDATCGRVAPAMLCNVR
jgi:hypothetical protein